MKKSFSNVLKVLIIPVRFALFTIIKFFFSFMISIPLLDDLANLKSCLNLKEIFNVKTNKIFILPHNYLIVCQ